MARPSEPLLAWLRKMLKSKGLNTAHVADASGIARKRVRKILAGTEDMTVDELMMLSDSLQLDPADLTGVGAADVAAEADDADVDPTAELDAIDPPMVDPWGNQPEQLFRIAFELGCDFFFLADTEHLDESGIPDHVLEPYQGRELPIKLDAAYHRYNEPRYDEDGITLTLSFDALYDCHFKWPCIKQFVLFPIQPEPAQPTEEEEEEQPAGVPHLRLVT